MMNFNNEAHKTENVAQQSITKVPHHAILYIICALLAVALTVVSVIAFSEPDKGDLANDGVVSGADGNDGTDGADGANGDTPYIGNNGNWWIGESDTGVFAGSADSSNPQGLDFYLKEDGTYAVSRGNAKYLSKIVIPETYLGKAVTEVIDFTDTLTELSEIVISDNVTSISEEAFSKCHSLRSVTFGSGLLSIGKNAFDDCEALCEIHISDIAGWCQVFFANTYSTPFRNYGKLYINGETVYDLVIPDGVTSISSYAFYGCRSITSIIVGNDVAVIESDAFSLCDNLTSVTLPENITAVDRYAFSTDLTEIINHSSLDLTGLAFTVHNGESKINNIDGYLFFTHSDGRNELVGYKGTDTDLVLPVNYNGENYSLRRGMFSYNSDITGAVISDGVTGIDENFSNCDNLKKLVIGSGITWIYDSFNNNPNLISLTIGKNVNYIGDKSFNATYPPEIINYSSLSSDLDDYSNESLLLNAVEIHTGESKIEKYGDFLFYTRNDGSSYLVKYTGDGVSVVLPENYNGKSYEINTHAFYGSKITSISLSKGVTAIGERAFRNCRFLKSISIPENITTIGRMAFSGCDRLVDVDFEKTYGWISVDLDGNETNISSYNLLSSEYRVSILKDDNTLKIKKD